MVEHADPAGQRQPVNALRDVPPPQRQQVQQCQNRQPERVDFRDDGVYPDGARQAKEQRDGHSREQAACKMERQCKNQRQSDDTPQQRYQRRRSRGHNAHRAHQDDKQVARHDVERVARRVQRAPGVEHDLCFANIAHIVMVSAIGNGLERRQIEGQQDNKHNEKAR